MQEVSKVGRATCSIGGSQERRPQASPLVLSFRVTIVILVSGLKYVGVSGTSLGWSVLIVIGVVVAVFVAARSTSTERVGLES